MLPRYWMGLLVGLAGWTGWLAVFAQQGSNEPLTVKLTSVPGKPFSAIMVSNGETFGKAARDAHGRTYVEVQPAGHPAIIIEIGDPVNGKWIRLSPAKHIANVSAWSPAVAAELRGPSHKGWEDLGLASLDGLTIHGYRHSETMSAPAGSSDATISRSRENWFSDDLEMIVQWKTSGANTGSTTSALSSVRLQEPDPALFEIPAGYTIESSSPQGKLPVDAAAAEANLIQRVDPVYPILARNALVQGTVKFSIAIGEDGLVKNIQLISGHPLLVTAASEAVRQWKYRPMLITNEPISVVAPVSVTFTLPVN